MSLSTRVRAHAFAIRRALATGLVHHVVVTGDNAQPYRVVDELELFNLKEVIGPHAVLSSADPIMLQPNARAFSKPLENNDV